MCWWECVFTVSSLETATTGSVMLSSPCIATTKCTPLMTNLQEIRLKLLWNPFWINTEFIPHYFPVIKTSNHHPHHHHSSITWINTGIYFIKEYSSSEIENIVPFDYELLTPYTNEASTLMRTQLQTSNFLIHQTQNKHFILRPPDPTIWPFHHSSHH